MSVRPELALVALPLLLGSLMAAEPATPADTAAADRPEAAETHSEPERSSPARALLRARIAEDARKAPVKALPKQASVAAPVAPPPTSATPSSPASASKPAAPEQKAATKSAAAPKAGSGQPPTVMPKVEVRKERITVLDQQLAKQDEDIARERRNLKVSETDSALNDAKVARPLAIFGGESTQFRQGVAAERIELMEAEKDLIEAIARARTKEERAELQKQLNELKAMRRELDRSMR